MFGPGVTVGDNVHILANSHIEGATVSSGARIGPFARLRPGAEIGEDAHIGNFVEVKKAVIGRGAKAILIDPDAPEFAPGLTLARKAMSALSLDFASVDLVRTGGNTLVLEVNSGVMLEMLVRLIPGGTALMDRIYHQALDRKLGC